LAQSSAAFARLQQKPSSARIRQALPPRTALVELLFYHITKSDPRTRLWLSERRLLAFVLRGDGEVKLVPLGPAASIERAVAEWRWHVTGAMRSVFNPLTGVGKGTDGLPPGGAGGAAASAVLRRRLWEPIEKHLDSMDTVLMAPDGALRVLPFAALPGRKPGTVLLEDYTIGYLQSGQQLLERPSAKEKSRGLLALGGADYDKPAANGRGMTWAALPGTEAETERIEALFRKRFATQPLRCLRGRMADRGRLLAALDSEKSKQRWRYLHLATHGFFGTPRLRLHPAVLGGWSVGAGAAPGLMGLTGSLANLLVASEPGLVDQQGNFDPTGRTVRIVEGNPMVLIGLVLAGANRPGQVSTLTAEEIAGLDLRGCELAVLSACETALGSIAGWQGVQGLPRGFHEAGVANVVTSLWSVSDSATSVLMEQFYQQLWDKKQSPLQALRQAQLFVLKHPQSVRQRAAELRELLVKRGISEEALQMRGLGKNALALPAGSSKEKRSPVAWWAPWGALGQALTRSGGQVRQTTHPDAEEGEGRS
jgi:CHAT domain-containing protein